MGNGHIIIYPDVKGYRPSEETLNKLIELLRREEMIGEEETTTIPNHRSFRLGAAYPRMGTNWLAPLSLGFALQERALDPDEEGITDPSDRIWCQQLFYLSLTDTQPPVDRSDPIWERMEKVLGTPLSWLYYHL